jgi:molybdopterin-guanine dinucleotide biosynthesis protein A
VTSSGVSAIVLAGGRSSRFGRDKLAEPIDGRALLLHAIDAVRPFASEVLVVVAPGAQPDVPAGARIVADARPFEGPLAGLLAGLGAAHEPMVLVTGGDMPELVGGVFDALLIPFDRPGTEATFLEQAGRARPLPMVLRREVALDVAASLVANGERRLRVLVDALAAIVIAENVWRALDPGGRSVFDIDTQADLR